MSLLSLPNDVIWIILKLRIESYRFRQQTPLKRDLSNYGFRVVDSQFNYNANIMLNRLCINKRIYTLLKSKCVWW